jgi:hypothetical protein
MDNRGADPLVHRGVAICVQNNFHPVLSTKLCEQSSNMVQDLVLGNLELRGNLIVRQADRDEAYQLFISLGQLHWLVINVHIASRAFHGSCHRANLGTLSRFALSVGERPLELELYAEFEEMVRCSRLDFTCPISHHSWHQTAVLPYRHER